jgi:pyrroline-5-carboxylate reductase
MDTTVGVVRSVSAGFTVADGWLAPPGAPAGFRNVILSPPASLEEVASRCPLIVLALPAEELRTALAALGGLLGGLVGGQSSDLRGSVTGEAGQGEMVGGTAIVSTCPVVSLRDMRALVGDEPALLRAVIPAGTAPGEGVAALAAEPGAPAEVTERVARSFAWVGTVEVTSEDALDAVAALALGGAAFVCAALEGLEDGAAREGLPRKTARAFAHQTAFATALLLRDHHRSPADLKDQVASPGGTTIAALATLEDAAVRGAFLRAVQRAAAGLRARRDAAGSGVVE